MAPRTRPERALRVAVFCLLVIGVALRLYWLELKPLHHDEGVNGFFLTDLYRHGVYHYDPENYHGPSLYYVALVSALLFGLNTWALRLVTVVFGVWLLWLTLALRGVLGRVGVVGGLLLLAVSPGAVYFSRYFIHEILLLTATLGIVVTGLRYGQRGDRATLLGLAAWAALLFTTKETAVVTVTVLVLATGCAAAYGAPHDRLAAAWLRCSKRLRLTALLVMAGWTGLLLAAACAAAYGAPRDSLVVARWLYATKVAAIVTGGVLVLVVTCALLYGALRGLRAFTRKGKLQLVEWLTQVRVPALAAAGLFLLINLILYSSFFTYPRGVVAALRTLVFWSKTAHAAHVHPYWTYGDWLWRGEPTILILGGLGLLAALIFAEGRAPLFLAFWALGMTAAYSLVPYKTPWLALNIVLPLALLGGYLLDLLSRRVHWSLAAALAAAALTISGTQAERFNFEHYDDDREVYVYAHTQRGFLEMIEILERITVAAGGEDRTAVTICAREHWPLPWYLRRYRFTAYQEDLKTAQGSAVVIGSLDQQPKIAEALGPGFARVGSFPLRGGVTLVLYARRNLLGLLHIVEAPRAQPTGTSPTP
jgi:uncharacterized protein (TIGR03663 family)